MDPTGRILDHRDRTLPRPSDQSLSQCKSFLGTLKDNDEDAGSLSQPSGGKLTSRKGDYNINKLDCSVSASPLTTCYFLGHLKISAPASSGGDHEN